MARYPSARHRRLHAQRRPPAAAARRAGALWHRVDRDDLIGQFVPVLRIVRTGLWRFSAFLARMLMAAGGRRPELDWHLTAGMNRQLPRPLRTRDQPAARTGTLPRLPRNPPHRGAFPQTPTSQAR